MATSTTGRRTPIFGPEPWAELRGHSWCHFDRWFALVCVTDLDAEPDGLRAALEAELASIHGRRDVVAKLSHLADLRQRLAGSDLTMGRPGVDRTR